MQFFCELEAFARRKQINNKNNETLHNQKWDKSK